jgi:NADP-reducing hydrogenase subunit HndB
MKSLEELKALRDSLKSTVNLRESDEHKIRILVGMATCGIFAGARPVLAAFAEEIAKQGIGDVTVGQTGCIGLCEYEPVVEIHEPGKEKVTYVKMTPERAIQVVNSHIAGGQVVSEFTVGHYTA